MFFSSVSIERVFILQKTCLNQLLVSTKTLSYSLPRYCLVSRHPLTWKIWHAPSFFLWRRAWCIYTTRKYVLYLYLVYGSRAYNIIGSVGTTVSWWKRFVIFLITEPISACPFLEHRDLQPNKCGCIKFRCDNTEMSFWCSAHCSVHTELLF